MPVLIKLMRIAGRPNSTMIMLFLTIIMTFIGFHMYLKDKHMQVSQEHTETDLKNENRLSVDIPNLKDQKSANEGMIRSL